MSLRPFAAPALALVSIGILSVGVTVRAQQSLAVEPDKVRITMLDSNRDQDGLSGPVRRVHTEMAKLIVRDGAIVEEPRKLLEVTTYDPQGNRIDNVYYPVGSASFKGNQEFTYDDQGHVIGMTLKDGTGQILSRESYTYEFDSFRNWTRMTSALVIFEGGKLVNEPFETTYRTISYYFADAVARMVQPSNEPPAVTTGTPARTVAENTPSTGENAAINRLPAQIKQASGPEPPKPIATLLPTTTNPPTYTNTRPDAAVEEPKNDVPPPPAGDFGMSGTSTAQTTQPSSQLSEALPSAKSPVSGGVINGKSISLPSPTFTARNLANGIRGKVIVEVTVSEQGQVIDAHAISGHPLLKSSAVAAAMLARFEPTLLSGKPVKATRTIVYNFDR